MVGIKPRDVVDFYFDPPNSVLKMVKEFKKIEKIDESTGIFYWRFKLPFMSDRDNIMRIYTQDLEDGSIFVCATSIERDDIPPIPGVFRMFQQINSYVRASKEDPNVVEYTEISHFDMKGKVPPLLLNMVMSSESVKEMKNMYNHMIKKYK
uniref:START domain-containing protein n=1 Tax=Strombidium rassoulzadegani TaxID=1082188 RepID=A0A7S3CKZ5_9SPIT